MTDCVHQIITSLERTQVLVTPGSQGPTGPRGQVGPPGEAFVMLAASPISGHSVVAVNGDGKLIYASANNLSHIGKVIGISNNAGGIDAEIEILTRDTLENTFWSWALGPVFLGLNGAIVQTTDGFLFEQCLGQAISPTSILINIQPPIIKG